MEVRACEAPKAASLRRSSAAVGDEPAGEAEKDN